MAFCGFCGGVDTRGILGDDEPETEVGDVGGPFGRLRGDPTPMTGGSASGSPMRAMDDAMVDDMCARLCWGQRPKLSDPEVSFFAASGGTPGGERPMLPERPMLRSGRRKPCENL